MNLLIILFLVFLGIVLLLIEFTILPGITIAGIAGVLLFGYILPGIHQLWNFCRNFNISIYSNRCTKPCYQFIQREKRQKNDAQNSAAWQCQRN